MRTYNQEPTGFVVLWNPTLLRGNKQLLSASLSQVMVTVSLHRFHSQYKQQRESYCHIGHEMIETRL